LDVLPGETVTCTFTNTKRGRIIVDKITNPSGDTQSFDFTTTGAGYVGFSLTDAAAPNSQEVMPGAYTVAEGAVTGWDLTSAICNMGETPGSLDVGPGETVTCTFTNTKRASLTIVKRIVNAYGGTATVGAFGITTTAGGLVFDLGTPDGTNTVKYTSTTLTNLTLGSKGLHENNITGYAEGSWSCVGNAGAVNSNFNTGSVVLGAGENVTCTITNNDLPATVCVRKFTDPSNSPTVFDFTTTGTGYVGFGISGVTAGDANRNCQPVNAGNYTARETVPANWVLTGIGTFGQAGTACSVSSNGGQGPGTSTGSGNLTTMTASMVLQNGDTVTCDFENTAVAASVTRTQGFWSTHTPLAYIAWFGGTAYGHTFPGVALTAGIGDRTLCGRDIGPADLTGLGKLMGGFWSDIAKKSTGSKRLAIDKSRMTLLQQMLAAEMNASAFGSTPIGGIAKFAQWEAAFCGTDQTAIQQAQSQAAAFNEGGDNGSFTPGTSADAQYAKSIANKPFWDNPSGLRGVFTSTPTTTGDGDAPSIIPSSPGTTADGE
jgi:hypothetical protein